MIRTVIRRGSEHKQNCEDAFFHIENEGYVFAGVFDGCSTGHNSYFASELLAKIMSATTSSNYHDENTENIANLILHETFEKLKTIRNELNLQTNELLSTIVFLINFGSKYTIVMVGDGAYMIDGHLTKIRSEGNAPDYLAYHLDEDFNKIWKSFHIISGETEGDIAIMTDGYDSFRKTENGMNRDLSSEEYENVLDTLLLEKKLIKSQAMLSRLLNILENEMPGLFHFDDLTIIRFIKDENNNTEV